MRRAFTLVELAIVLVILGLLVGGIMAGQSLVRAAELRKVTSDLQRYRSAFFAFKDKYFGWPGDITNATLIWGKDNTNCSWHTGTVATPGTCNGDGNGVIGFGGQVALASSEHTRAWQQLALAGLIEGNYSGVNNAAAPYISGGANLPVILSAPIGISLLTFGITYNPFQIGAPQISGGAYLNTNALYGPAFTARETWSIDTKMDDGNASTGTITGSGLGTTSSCKSGSPAQYVLTDDGINCTIGYRGLD